MRVETLADRGADTPNRGRWGGGAVRQAGHRRADLAELWLAVLARHAEAFGETVS